MKTTIPPARSSISHSLPLITYHYLATPKPSGGGSLITIILALVCLGLASAPKAFGVTPAPDGGYANGNTAEGTNALFSLTTGANNTALGFNALYHNTTGYYNTASGYQTLFTNTTGFKNTADGFRALYLNTTGHENTAEGLQALYNNTSGFDNTAVGLNALFHNTTGSQNTATGFQALFNNTIASSNTADGYKALSHNTTGEKNTAVGAGAGPNIIAGVNNTYIGDFVGTMTPDESSTIRIGDLSNGNGAGSLECFIGGIFNNNQPVGGSVVEVTLDLANDKLGWDVGPNQGASAPVQRGAPQSRSAPLPGARPQHQSMLNDKVEKLQATVAQQQKQIEALTAQLREQAAQIQKVSAQIEMSKFATGRICRGGPAPQVVVNKP